MYTWEIRTKAQWFVDTHSDLKHLNRTAIADRRQISDEYKKLKIIQFPKVELYVLRNLRK